MSSEKDRRQFLTGLGASAAGLWSVGAKSARYSYSANETLNIGCIGTGGRCRSLMRTIKKVPGVRLAAVCDIWDDHLEKGRELADPAAFTSKHYHDLLESKHIDAVIIGSPDHWHVPMTVDACKAGKDVYVEKPLTHDPSEGDAVIRAQNEYGRIVQVGMQQRSMPQFRKAYEIIQSGVLGKIHKVHLTWNRNTDKVRRRPVNIDPSSLNWKQFLGSAREQPFDPYRFRNWRWFWDFGGGILTDLMVHYHDVANWYLDLGNPTTATTIGDNFITAGLWETPDTIQTLLRFEEEQVQVYFEGTFVNARNAAMLEFMGTEATLYLDRGRYEVLPEKESKLAPSHMILGRGARGADFYDPPVSTLLHLQNWVDCIHSRGRPRAPAEVGVKVAADAHLANLAYRNGRVEHGQQV